MFIIFYSLTGSHCYGLPARVLQAPQLFLPSFENAFLYSYRA